MKELSGTDDQKFAVSSLLKNMSGYQCAHIHEQAVGKGQDVSTEEEEEDA